MGKSKKTGYQFKIGDYVRFKNAGRQSYFNKPTKVLAILPSGLVQHGNTLTCYSQSSPLDLVLADISLSAGLDALSTQLEEIADR